MNAVKEILRKAIKFVKSKIKLITVKFILRFDLNLEITNTKRENSSS